MATVTKYMLYTSTGRESLSDICQNHGASILDVVRINGDVKSSDGKLLIDYQIRGGNLPVGTLIKIPYPNTGSIEYNYETYVVHESLGEIRGLGYSSEFGSSHKTLRGSRSGSSNKSFQDFNCTVVVLLAGSVVGSPMSLPVYPNEFSDENSAAFNSQSLLGRSVDYQIYETSSRSVSFTLNLHDELCEDHNYIRTLVAYIQSACYPEYGASGEVKPPEICFTIGDQFRIRGVLESCSANWKAPIIDNKLVNCDLSISVKETTGPWASSQIRGKGGHRG